MRVTLLTVGRPRDRAFLALCDDYLRRCRPLFRVTWDSVSAGDPRGSQLPERAVASEGQRLLRKLGPGALDVAVDESCTRRSSQALARWLGELRDGGRSLRLVVGGAFGLAPEVRQHCRQALSLSPMTLPHELALLVLAEQLYRAKTLLAHEPYHH